MKCVCCRFLIFSNEALDLYDRYNNLFVEQKVAKAFNSKHVQENQYQNSQKRNGRRNLVSYKLCTETETILLIL